MNPETVAEMIALEALRGDTALVALLGGADRIIPGWPMEDLAATDYPLLTFYTFGPGPVARGVQRVRLTVDAWVWPSGPAGGRTRLQAIDNRVADLFTERHYQHEGHWLAAENLGFRDYPGGPDEPSRRLREIALDITTT